MDAVRALHFTRPGQLVTASEDCTLKVWDLNAALKNQQSEHEPIQTLRGHTGSIMSMAGCQGTIFSGDRYGNIALWHVPSDLYASYDEPYCDSESSQIAR